LWILGGCALPLAYPVDPEISEEPLQLELNESLLDNLTLYNPTDSGPKEVTQYGGEWDSADLIECVSDAVSRKRDDIHIVDNQEFWRSVVGQNKRSTTIHQLLEDPESQDLTTRSNVRFLVTISGRTTVVDDTGGLPGLAEYFTSEEHTRMEAVVIDLVAGQVLGITRAEASGTETYGRAAIIFFIGASPMTASSACSGLGGALAKQLPREESRFKASVVVLRGGGPGTAKYAIAQAKELEEFRNRAENGDAEAQYEIANRSEIWSNEKIALYCQSASQGYFKSQFQMDKLFQHGYGFVEQDLIKAYLWYKAAEEQGYPPSARSMKTSSGWACCNPLPELDSLVEQMSAEEKTEADRLMSMWDPSTESCQLEGNEAAPAN
jgi:hypothetical protein